VSAPDLTAVEQAHVRKVLRYLRATVGNWETVARCLHFDPPTLSHVMVGDKNVSPTMAYRVARFVRMKIDDVLEGKFIAPGRACPLCGHEKEES